MKNLTLLVLAFAMLAAIIPVKITSVKQIENSVVITGALDCNKYSQKSSIKTVGNMINVSIFAVDPSPYAECGKPKPFTVGINPPQGTWRIYVNGKYYMTFRK